MAGKAECVMLITIYLNFSSSKTSNINTKYSFKTPHYIIQILLLVALNI